MAEIVPANREDTSTNSQRPEVAIDDVGGAHRLTRLRGEDVSPVLVRSAYLPRLPREVVPQGLDRGAGEGNVAPLAVLRGLVQRHVYVLHR